MSISKEDSLTLEEVVEICTTISNENIEISKGSIRPKTEEFLDKFKLTDEDVCEVIKSLEKEDYFAGPIADRNPKYAHPFWIFIKYVDLVKVRVYIKIKIVNHKRKINVFSIHEEGVYEL